MEAFATPKDRRIFVSFSSSHAHTPDPSQIALGVQQPWAELILRGIKTIEVRQRPTIPRPLVYLYASRRLSRLPAAELAVRQHQLDLAGLSFGCLLGTMEILDCRRSRRDDMAQACLPAELLRQAYSWVLGNVRRFPEPLRPRHVPYGSWFYPFQRLETKHRGRRGHGRH